MQQFFKICRDCVVLRQIAWLESREAECSPEQLLPYTSICRSQTQTVLRETRCGGAMLLATLIQNGFFSSTTASIPEEPCSERRRPSGTMPSTS